MTRRRAGKETAAARRTVTCEDARQELPRADGQIASPQTRQAVARHVSGCSTCAEWERQSRAVMALFSAAPPAVVPASLRRRVEARLGTRTTGAAKEGG